MFERFESDPAEAFEFTFDGKVITANSADSVASALLAAGTAAFRNTPRDGVERGPFCMMGVCFECLVQIGGETVQGCMVSATPGLIVSRVPRPGTVE